MKEFHMMYNHDGLEYDAILRLGATTIFDGTAEYYLQIPISNNCFVNDADSIRNNVILHRGPTQPRGIGGSVSLTKDTADGFETFVQFASSWFGCDVEDITFSVFDNGEEIRMAVVMSRKDMPRRQNHPSSLL